MKKIILFMLITLCCFAFTISFASADKGIIIVSKLPEKKIANDAKLPDSVIIIEDEAFEGTAFANIVLPENVEIIGDYAFADINTLKNITIPNSTKNIGRNAFKGSNNVTITCAPKGYVRAWAHENGIPYNSITCFYAFRYTARVNGGLTNIRDERLETDSEEAEEKKPKPTGRMTGELKAEKKGTITAFHIQGRSPPMV